MPRIHIEVEQEMIALGTPAKVRVYVDGMLRATVTGAVEMQHGGDGGRYPAVTLETKCSNGGVTCDMRRGPCACGAWH